MALLEKLKLGVDNTKMIPLMEEQIRLRVLTDDELLKCRADALAYAETLGLDAEGMTVDMAIRQLYKAATDVEGKPLAGTYEKFRGLLTRRWREYLIGEYLELERECSPSLDRLTEEEFEQLLEEVKKSPDLLRNSSNTNLLRRLARYLENRPARSLPASGSTC